MNLMNTQEHAAEQSAIENKPFEHEGYFSDPISGEVVGMIVPKFEFQVIDAESADWVLEKICDAESEMSRLDMVLAAVKERIETQKKAQENRVKYLKWKFGGELEEFAKNNLPHGKKTWKGTYGEVSFRTVKPRLAYAGESDAIAWAKDHCPEAVKVEERFLISLVPAELVAKEMESPAAPFYIEPGSESVTIKTVKGVTA